MWNVHLVDDCIDSTHISSEGSREATTKARAQGPMSSTASVRPPIKSSWNPDQIDKYICPTDIHHSNQKPSSTCMLCTTSHTFVYNQCPQLKNLTGTCQKQHQCDQYPEIRRLPTWTTSTFWGGTTWRHQNLSRHWSMAKKNCKPPVGHPLHRLPVALLPLQSPPRKHAAVSTKNDQGVGDTFNTPFAYHIERIILAQMQNK